MPACVGLKPALQRLLLLLLLGACASPEAGGGETAPDACADAAAAPNAAGFDNAACQAGSGAAGNGDRVTLAEDDDIETTAARLLLLQRVPPTMRRGEGASAAGFAAGALQTGPALVASKRRAHTAAAAAARRLGARRTKGRRLADGNLGEYFAESYGSGFSWFLGTIVKDVVSLGRVSMRARIGLMTSGSVPIGNAFPVEGGQASTDGILGLAPGCLLSDCSEDTDLLSAAVSGRRLAAHEFTLCIDDGPDGGGRLHLGGGGSEPPPATAHLVLNASQELYTLARPSDGSAVSFLLGGAKVTELNGATWESASPIVDSGTGGLALPEHILSALMRAVETQLAERGTCDHICGGSPGRAAADYRELLDGSRYVLKDCAECIREVAPDLRVDLNPGGSLVIDGNSLLYQTTPCSGLYLPSWIGSPGPIVFGTAFLRGKVVRFDAANRVLIVMGPSAGCPENGIAGGSHSVPLEGVEGQVMGQGVIVAKLTAGTPPQEFVVQLDTGSQDLLLTADTCQLYGLQSCMEGQPCQSCFFVVENSKSQVPEEGVILPFDPHNSGSGERKFSQACSEYMDPLVKELSAQVQRPELIAGFLLPQLASALGRTSQPWSSCLASREACDSSHYFCANCSSTLEPKGWLPPAASEHPPPYTARVNCAACA